MKLFGRTDILFDGDDASRFLPWLIAFMVFLAVFAIAGSVALNKVAQNWVQGIEDAMTVQIPAGDDAAQLERQVRRATAALKSVNGVKFVQVISNEDIQRQLAPWLGEASNTADLPLPGVLEIIVDRLSQRLSAIVPGAVVDDHRAWISGVVSAIRSTELLAILIIILIAAATVGTVIFTTRAGLALHRQAIELLHLTGARDVYIARQFATRAFFLGLRGGAIGLALAIPALALVSLIMSRLETSLIPNLAPGIAGWVLILLLMPLVALIAMITARFTVIKTLTGIV
ncbi:MAG: cell division protein [Proteobacteria bacterium]|nr:cell division protein [Pseudomonadota bacterium]